MKQTLRARPVLLLAFGMAFQASGQQLNTPAAIHQNFSAINPAFLGFSQAPSVLLSYRKQWAGIPNSPEQLSALADLNFMGRKTGLGLGATANSVGMIKRNLFSLGYAYRVKLNDNQQLGFGLSAGVERTTIDFSRIIAYDPSEITGMQQIQGNTIGAFTVGVMYRLKQWQVGLSAQLYTGNRLSFVNPVNQNAFRVNKVPNYTFVTRLPIKMSERWIYTPSVAVLSTQGLPLFVDNLHQFTYNETIQLGAGYRQSTNAYLQFGYTFFSQIYVSYVYQHNFSSLNKQLSNSHELILKFTLNRNGESAGGGAPKKLSRADELQEQIDIADARMKQLSEKLDSLEKTMSHQKQEIENLKIDQLTIEELKQAMKDSKAENDSSGSRIKLTSYEVINVNNEQDILGLAEDANSSYYIVFGAFRNIEKARELKKVLKRDLNMEMKLISMEVGSKTMYLVTQPKEYPTVKEGSSDLLKLKKTKKNDYQNYLNGEPWLLKMKK